MNPNLDYEDPEGEGDEFILNEEDIDEEYEQPHRIEEEKERSITVQSKTQNKGSEKTIIDQKTTTFIKQVKTR